MVLDPTLVILQSQLQYDTYHMDQMENTKVLPPSEWYKTYVQHSPTNWIFHKNILWAVERRMHIAHKLKSFRVF